MNLIVTQPDTIIIDKSLSTIGRLLLPEHSRRPK